MRRLTMRDKLIELIQSAVGGCARHWAELIADALIANGVTLQQWIPVSERLPEKNCKCLVCVDVDVWGREYKAIVVENYVEEWLGWYSDGGKIPNITHWMPLPSTEGLNDTGCTQC
jgi:hypothetical protein